MKGTAPSRTMSRLALGVVLVAMWILLWGSISLGNIIAGIAVVAVLFLVYPSSRPLRPSLPIRPLAVLRLGWNFALSVLTTNVMLAQAVLGPQRRVHSGLVRVDLCLKDPMLLTMVTYMTALTPGAVAVDIDSSGDHPVMWIHVLTLHDPFQMERNTVELERRCTLAFGTSEQIWEVQVAAAERAALRTEGGDHS